MWLTLFQGLAIGFAIAAPVGPIGMLCIRRTLQAGAPLGLATGLGAACADAMYGLAVAGGLGATGWLLAHARTVSLVGAALLAWLGLGALRAFAGKSRAAAPSATPDAAGGADRPGLPLAFGSTFALTAANPATIVSFIGVVAALGGAAAAAPGAAYALVAGIFAGSMLWWCTLVGIVRAAHRMIPPQALRWIDLATGAVLLGTGLWVGGRALAG